MKNFFLKTPAATFFSLACVLTIIVGFWFHTCYGATIFAKYSQGYFIFLCVLSLLIAPVLFLLLRFTLTRQEISLPSGKKWIFKRRVKILAILCLFFALDASLQSAIEKKLQQIHSDMMHPFLQNTLRPNNAQYQINRWGFRGEDIEREKASGTFRIFFFGGSTVYCGDVDFEDTHCRILEKNLRKAYPNVKIEVQNIGTDGHCSEHSLIKLLCEVQDFSPDLLIIYHAINDMCRSASPEFCAIGGYRNDYGHYFGPLGRLVKPEQNKMLMQIYFNYWFSDFRFDRVRILGPEGQGVHGFDLMFAARAEVVEIDKWQSLDAFARNMESFADIAKIKNIPLLMSSQPHFYKEEMSPAEREVISLPAMIFNENGKKASIASLRKGMDAFNKKSATIARSKDVPFLDLEKMVPKTFEYFWDDIHYTKKGNQIIGEAFSERIISWGIVTNK